MCVGGWGFRRPFSFGSLRRERKKQCRANFLILWSNRHDKICNRSSLCQRVHEKRPFSGHVTQFACLALIKRGNENRQAGVEVYQGFPTCPDSWIHPNYVFISVKTESKKAEHITSHSIKKLNLKYMLSCWFRQHSLTLKDTVSLQTLILLRFRNKSPN